MSNKLNKETKLINKLIRTLNRNWTVNNLDKLMIIGVLFVKVGRHLEVSDDTLRSIFNGCLEGTQNDE